MTTLAYIIVFSTLGGVLSLFIAALLLTRKKFAEALAEYATPFAAGALLAAVFLDLLKEGAEDAEIEAVLIAAMIGILIFFIAEHYLQWFHHHHQHKKTDPAISLIIVGDTLHNVLDGMAIAAAFLISIPTGIITTIAVAAHEIPQEIGDFGLLLKKGLSRLRVLAVNVLSALATVIAAVIVYFLGSANDLPVSILLGVSAGFLLYIALSDIVPMLHEARDDKRLYILRPIMLILGMIVVGLAVYLTHTLIH